MSNRSAHRAWLREQHKPEIFAFVEDMDLEMKAIQGDWHYRVEGVLDVFPTRKRYCWLPTQEWGWYEDYEELGRIFLERQSNV